MYRNWISNLHMTTFGFNVPINSFVRVISIGDGEGTTAIFFVSPGLITLFVAVFWTWRFCRTLVNRTSCFWLIPKTLQVWPSRDRTSAVACCNRSVIEGCLCSVALENLSQLCLRWLWIAQKKRCIEVTTVFPATEMLASMTVPPRTSCVGNSELGGKKAYHVPSSGCPRSRWR
jgi:hypothetical protein